MTVEPLTPEQEEVLGKRIADALEKGNDLQEYDGIVRRHINRTFVKARSVDRLASELRGLVRASVHIGFAINRTNDLAEYDALRSKHRKSKPQRARFKELQERLWPTEEADTDSAASTSMSAWQSRAAVRRTKGIM